MIQIKDVHIVGIKLTMRFVVHTVKIVYDGLRKYV